MTFRPGKKDLVIYKGAYFDEPFQFLENDEITPIDLTGASMRMQIRSALDSPTVILELTTANSKIILVDAAQGQFKLSLTAVETATLTAIENAVYDLEVQPQSGANLTYRLLMGKITIVEEVTK